MADVLPPVQKVYLQESTSPQLAHRINRSEVLRFARDIGLSMPIFIVHTRALKDPRYGTQGAYTGFGVRVNANYRHYVPPVAAHHVHIAPNLPGERANAILAHELTHALQCERDYGSVNDDFFSAYRAELKSVHAGSASARRYSHNANARYKAISFEAEAIEAEEYAPDYCMAS